MKENILTETDIKLVKAVRYCGEPVLVACDSKCDKAWGINNRPRAYMKSEAVVLMVRDELYYETEYLQFFRRQNPGKKTYVVDVASKRLNRLILGRIKWYSQWRQYVFIPEADTLYSTACIVPPV